MQDPLHQQPEKVLNLLVEEHQLVTGLTPPQDLLESVVSTVTPAEDLLPVLLFKDTQLPPDLLITAAQE